MPADDVYSTADLRSELTVKCEACGGDGLLSCMNWVQQTYDAAPQTVVVMVPMHYACLLAHPDLRWLHPPLFEGCNPS